MDGQKRELKIIYHDAPTSLTGSDQYQIITNFLVYPGYYEDGDKQHGLDRYQQMKKALDSRKGLVKDDQDAMDILERVALKDDNNDIYSLTVHSVVYNQSQKRVYWVGILMRKPIL